MSKVFSDLKPVNHASRNGFDLSRRSVFSTKAGMILPVFCQATLPDSEYKIDLRQLLRTQPFQTAAFTGFSINYDFFFVPNNYSYSSFNEFIAQRSDSKHVGQPSRNIVPVFDFHSFMELLLPLATYDYLIDTFFGKSVAMLPWADTGESQFASITPHYCVTSPNMPWTSICLEVIRSLDMFGYGNFLPLVKDYGDLILSEVFQGIRPNDYHDFCVSLEQFSESLGYNFEMETFNGLYNIMLISLNNAIEGNAYNFPLSNISDYEPTLWPFLAYNKAFYEFYRNVYYDEKFQITCCGQSSLGNPYFSYDYVQLFNYDDYLPVIFDTNTLSKWCRVLAMMVPKPHLYKKDLFTGVLPSTQFGDVSVMMDNNTWYNLFMKSDGTSSISNGAFLRSKPISGSSDGSAAVGFTNTSSVVGSADAKFRFDPTPIISVLEQRKADAMQRFKERMLRAGNKVKDVFKAHGWSEPYSASDAMPYFIGTFDGRLDVNTVAATAPTDSVELGQLAANGVSAISGKPLRFKSHDFGYIIGVMYIIKDVEYDAYGLERQHCLTEPFDYPYPELQNISLFPIDNLELSSYLRFGDTQDYSTDIPDILGYLPRFMEYKTAVDKVHGEFFSAPIARDRRLGNSDSGVFSDWVTPRYDISYPHLKAFLYHSPDCVDNLFLQRSNALQSTDQFLVNCLFDVMAVEPVSVIGLPI